MSAWKVPAVLAVWVGGLALIGRLAIRPLPPERKVEAALVSHFRTKHAIEDSLRGDSVRRVEWQRYAVTLFGGPGLSDAAVTYRWLQDSLGPVPRDSKLLRFRHEDSLDAAAAMVAAQVQIERIKLEARVEASRRRREACGVVRGEYVCLTVR